MSETTCAACDCKIEGEAIHVNVGGKAVEVCCDECATVLREAQAATSRNESQLDHTYFFPACNLFQHCLTSEEYVQRCDFSRR